MKANIFDGREESKKLNMKKVPKIGFGIFRAHQNGRKSSFSEFFRITDDFEREWTVDRTMTIESALREGADLNQSELFTRLLEIDILLGMKNSSLVAENVYLSRFPQFSQEVHEVYGELTSPDYEEEPKESYPVRVEHYQIEELLGKGAMGTVRRALDLKLGRYVAIKFISRSLRTSKEATKRFLEELSRQGRLDNEHIVRAYHYGEAGAQPYLVMEYVDGLNLERYVLRSQERHLSTDDAVDVIIQAAHGLRHIHDCRIMHRDIKPGNLIRRNSDGRVKICDIGLGVLLDEESAKQLNREGARRRFLIGTLGYAAPEASADPEKFSPELDIYGLGGTFFFLLTGYSPLRLALSDNPNVPPVITPERLASFFRNEKIQAPDKQILSLIARMTAENPAERLHSADEVITELKTWQTARSALALSLKKRSLLHLLLISLMFVLLALVTAVIFSLPEQEQGLTSAPLKMEKIEYIPHPVPDSLPKEFSLEAGAEFVLIAPCEFAPGFTPLRVTLSEPYYLGKHEVTVQEFRAFVEATGYQTIAERNREKADSSNENPNSNKSAGKIWNNGTWRDPGFEQTDRHPAVNVSFIDVEAYLQWVNRNGPIEVAPGVKMRCTLPTVAQWINACRGGTTTRFFWGENPEEGAGYLNARGEDEEPVLLPNNLHFPFKDGYFYPAPAGSFKPNGFGIYDILGNVREWCRDGCGSDAEKGLRRVDPMGRGPRKMICGTDFLTGARRYSPYQSIAHTADYYFINTGFRLALIPVKK